MVFVVILTEFSRKIDPKESRLQLKSYFGVILNGFSDENELKRGDLLRKPDLFCYFASIFLNQNGSTWDGLAREM